MDRGDKFTWQKGDLRHMTEEEALEKYREVQEEIKRKQREREENGDRDKSG